MRVSLDATVQRKRVMTGSTDDNLFGAETWYRRIVWRRRLKGWTSLRSTPCTSNNGAHGSGEKIPTFHITCSRQSLVLQTRVAKARSRLGKAKSRNPYSVIFAEIRSAAPTETSDRSDLDRLVQLDFARRDDPSLCNRDDVDPADERPEQGPVRTARKGVLRAPVSEHREDIGGRFRAISRCRARYPRASWSARSAARPRRRDRRGIW